MQDFHQNLLRRYYAHEGNGGKLLFLYQVFCFYCFCLNDNSNIFCKFSAYADFFNGDLNFQKNKNKTEKGFINPITL